MLTSLRLKKISEVGGGSHKVRQISLFEGYGLLDSGATSALCQGSAEEICLATPVEVQLGVGSASMHVNPQGTLLTERKVQPILPMAALPRLGCVIQWSDVGFSIKHPVLGLLPTRLNGTSPELPAPLLLKLITEYEGLITREDREREGKQRLWNVLTKITPDVVNPQLWLEHHISEGTVDETVLHVWVRAAFPELPERIASRIACAPAFASERVPFNRRTRRRLFDRNVPTLLSLFSGVQHWSKWPGQVLHVDLLKGSDLLSPDTFGMLLQSALHGSVDGLTAGPPCRTMSVLRMKEDGGPRQVRDKFGVGRFGKEGLSPAEQAVVDDGMLMAVIQASSHVLEKPKPLFFLEQPAAPSDYAPESDNHVRCPSLWAWPEAERIWALIGGWLANFD